MNTLYRHSAKSYLIEIAVLIGTAIFFSFAFPGFLSTEGIGFIAFFAVIPLFAVIRHTSWKAIVPYGFLYGFTFYTCFNYWLTTFHPLAILLVPIIKGGEMLALFPALKAADSLSKRFGFLIQSVIWVAYAYLSQSWFAGYPYGTIAYAAWEYLPFIQIAAFSGIWGVTFLMILPQAFLGAFVSDYVSSQVKPSLTTHLRKNLVTVVLFAAAILGTLIYRVHHPSYLG